MARRPFIIDSANVRASSLKAYQPLRDEHLTMFFGSPVVRRNLVRSGVVNENGEVMEKGRMKLPKVILPPIAAAPPPLKPSSSVRSLNFRDTRSLMTKRPSNDHRASERNLSESRAKFGVTTLKPMSHDEYLRILQKYASLPSVPEQETHATEHQAGILTGETENGKDMEVQDTGISS